MEFLAICNQPLGIVLVYKCEFKTKDKDLQC